MHKLPLAAGCSLLLGLAQAAHADHVHGTRSEKLLETRHEATLTVHPGFASMVVRRTVHNGGERHDQAVFWIDVPQGAVATGLRTLGTLNGAPQWFAGELMEAEAAAAKYRELTGIGGYYPKDPALLSWRSQQNLALQVFPVAPGGPKTIEYTFTLPTEYRGGAHHVVLPAMGSKEVPLALRARPAPGGTLLGTGESHRAGGTDIALRMRQPPAVGGALAVVPFADARVLTRYRVEAAPRLSEVPRDPRVVVVLDASRSLSDEQLKAELVAARAYLSHFPDGRAEVLHFDRLVHGRHGRFVAMREARRDLESFQLQGHNGSDVEGALMAADALLAKQPAHHPKRIVLFTDTLTKAELTVDRLAAALGESGALLHVAVVHAGDPHVARDDDHEWLDLTRPTGGLVWSAAVDAGSDNRAVLEELVRPLRIHHFELSAPLIDASLLEHEETLAEGEGVSFAWIEDKPIPWLAIRGELWTQPLRKRLDPDAAEAKRWSALVFGSDLMHELSEEEMMTLAMRGRAVSPVTSYLAIEPGVRPSTEGLDESEGSGGLGLTGTGFGSGHGRLGSPSPAEAAGWLSGELGAHWKNCGGKRSTRFTVETTLREVVDVASRVNDQLADESTAVSCLMKAAWALMLPPLFDPFPGRRWDVAI